jgi:hypothetical protein
MVLQRRRPSGFIGTPPTVIGCMNSGSIDAMRLDQTLGQSSPCLRAELYVDDDFP